MGLERRNILPDSLPPRGLCRVEAAAYIGVSPSTFDKMIQEGLMPPAKRINTRCVWDRRKLDLAFDDLPEPVSQSSQHDKWANLAV